MEWALLALIVLIIAIISWDDEVPRWKLLDEIDEIKELMKKESK